jgi:quercetin dioxygenase-like cupin family protein
MGYSLNSFFKCGLLTILLFTSVSSLLSQVLPKGAIQIKADEIKWVDSPEPFLSGVQIAILEGNPKETGIFTVRAKLPPYFIMPAHQHSRDERVTVLEGAVNVGFGDTLNGLSATKFTAGSFYLNPASIYHYIFADSEGCILQITCEGPWETEFLIVGRKRNE